MREGEILKGRKTLRTSLVPVGYPVWVKEKPSKLEVWGLKSRFNFQAFPAAFHGLPAVYLFWINVINPPVPSVTQKKRVTVKKITRPLLLVHRAWPTRLGGSEIPYHRIIFCLGLTCKSPSDSSQGNVSQMPCSRCSSRGKTRRRSLQVLEESHMHWCGLEKKKRKKAGVKHLRKHSKECPLAHLVERKMGGISLIDVRCVPHRTFLTILQRSTLPCTILIVRSTKLNKEVLS